MSEYLILYFRRLFFHNLPLIVANGHLAPTEKPKKGLFFSFSLLWRHPNKASYGFCLPHRERREKIASRPNEMSHKESTGQIKSIPYLSPVNSPGLIWPRPDVACSKSLLGAPKIANHFGLGKENSSFCFLSSLFGNGYFYLKTAFPDSF